MPEQDAPRPGSFVEATTPLTDAATQAKIVAAKVRDLFEQRLGTSAFHLISSEPGVGRYSALGRELEARFPEEHLILPVSRDTMYVEVLANHADALETAKVVVLDEPLNSAPWLRDQFINPMVARRLEVPMEFESPCQIVLRDDVVFVISVDERPGSADETAQWLEQVVTARRAHVSLSRRRAG